MKFGQHVQFTFLCDQKLVGTGEGTLPTGVDFVCSPIKFKSAIFLKRVSDKTAGSGSPKWDFFHTDRVYIIPGASWTQTKFQFNQPF